MSSDDAEISDAGDQADRPRAADQTDEPRDRARDEADAAADDAVDVELVDEELDDAGGLGGGFDLGSLLEQAQQMQQQLLDAQASAAEQTVVGQAGGGVVRVTLTGTLEFQQVEISPDVIDPDDPELLEDLVLAALRDAMQHLEDLQRQALGGGLGLGGSGGLDLGGLLGGAPE